jgi:hypothetical protein
MVAQVALQGECVLAVSDVVCKDFLEARFGLLFTCFADLLLCMKDWDLPNK